MDAPSQAVVGEDDEVIVRTTPLSGAPQPETGDVGSIVTGGDAEPKLYPGTGIFVKRVSARDPADAGVDEDGVNLNFVDTDLAEVVAVVLGEILEANYVIDPGVKGTVTIQTSRPLSGAALLPTLETILSLNGAVIVRSQGLYKVVPIAKAQNAVPPVVSRSMAARRGRGFMIQVVPLRYVAAGEMEKILGPTALKENILHVDNTRNILILGGTEAELAAMADTIDIFDVDWLKGMSFGLFRVKFTAAETLAAELEKVFFQSGRPESEGLIQFVPIERLNAIVVITQQPAYLARVREWVERLDQSGDGPERRIFVYRVQNSRATNLAASLREIFSDEDEEEPPPSAAVAPGLQPVEIRSPSADQAAQAPSGAEGEAAPVPIPQFIAPGQDAGVAIRGGGRVRIIADEEHNALIVLATPQDYRMIEATIRELDVVPMQVLIQATIFTVTLTDDLSYGVRWFLERGNHSVDIDVLPAAAGAFSYAFSSANFTASIEALSNITDLKVVSSPELLVLDNQTATLQVGDQVPVATRQSVSVTDPEAPVVNSIQFRNTGTILNVTPRVNAGGMVTLDIEQEVSDIASAEPTVTPTIFQRTIRSTVAVQSGQTIALGGLISESNRQGRSGVPVLMEIPILGALFRSNEEETRRTELLVLITPIAVRNPAEALAVTREMRRRMTRVHQFIRRSEALGTVPLARAPQIVDERSIAPTADAPPSPAGSAPRSTDSLADAGAAPIETPRQPAKPAYLLHLASYRSEAMALRMWPGLQEAHPDSLTGLSPVVRRVELGARGTYYRLHGGPIGDRAQALALCRSLRAREQYCDVLPE